MWRFWCLIVILALALAGGGGPARAETVIERLAP